MSRSPQQPNGKTDSGKRASPEARGAFLQPTVRNPLAAKADLEILDIARPSAAQGGVLQRSEIARSPQQPKGNSEDGSESGSSESQRRVMPSTSTSSSMGTRATGFTRFIGSATE